MGDGGTSKRGEVAWPTLPLHGEGPPSVSGLLADAARQLFRSLREGDLLLQACRITRDVLRSDLVVALEWSDEAQAFRTKAQFGLSEEDWAAYQIVELPAEITQQIRARLADQVVSCFDVAEPAPSAKVAERREIARKVGIGPILLLGLRSRGALTGVMVACRTGAAAGFEWWAIEVAEGLSPLLGASLENQHLLAALEGANRAQAEFLASMSHELRTPLNVITGYLDILLEDAAGPLTTEQRELCERIRTSALQQLSLVAEALEISRRDVQGQIPVRREPVSIRDLVADLEREATLRRAGSALRVIWEIEDPGLRVVTDSVKLRMIVRNLVDNAIKFTPRGEVRIAIGLADEQLVWRVTDTGIGIADAERGAIFEAFRQVGSVRSTGLGLGLYIVRRLATALNGTVDVASLVGAGSTFTVRVPVTPAASPLPPPAA